ncbi:LuxR C-terminal-related transcriptional regulator [Cellulomonas sp. NPDC057328]|uniref:helix-turn-helix transcriptional regulator n=1 Tax=Cellulomonas sp. NPDC057328 TaxID=3346101 RepID=UPI003641BF6E
MSGAPGTSTDAERRGRVTVSAPPGASLAPALVAALAARGWQVDAATGAPDGAAVGRRHVVVAEDDLGSVRVHLPAGLGRPGVVVVASLRSMPAVVPLVVRGALVVDRTAPFLSLLRSVEDGLRGGLRGDPEAVRRRVAERAALDRLTAAERATLRALVAGTSAATIATETRHSLHTVRSHIRSILAKLGVGTQLAAVALAHRAGLALHEHGAVRNPDVGDPLAP